MALPEPGDVFESKYRIDAILGEGGFGRVYEAFDIELERRVAVKLLKPSRKGDDLTRARRFMREVKAIAGLNHPSTITMYDYGRTDDGLLFMVSELVDGVDLSELCEQRSFTQDETVHVLMQLLESLREAHSAGLLHRDIKPDNIRVFAYDGDPLRVKLLDFGIVKSFTEEQSNLTATGRVVGTVRYMSPEQLTGGDLSPASDLYSLGLVAFEMLFGGQARRADDLLEGRFVRVDPGERISTSFARVLNRMLEPRVDLRAADAGEVLLALRTLDSGQPFASPIPAVVEDLPRQTEFEQLEKQRPGRWAWLAAAFVGLAVVVAAAMVLFVNEDDAVSVREPNVPTSELRSPPTRSSNPLQRVVDPIPAPLKTPGCGKPFKQGIEHVTATFGLDEQRWSVTIPEGYDPNEPMPLLIILMGVGSPTFVSEIGRFATQRHYIAAHVIGAHPKVDATEPPQFEIARVRSIVREMKARWCVDEDRIFVFGNHGMGAPVNGARFAEQLRCEPWIRAIAITTKNGTTPEPVGPYCPNRSVPILQLGRTRPEEGWLQCTRMDPTPCDRVEGVLSPTEQRWWARNRCNGEPEIVSDDHGWSCWSGACEVPTKFCRSDEQLYQHLTATDRRYSRSLKIVDQFFSELPVASED